MQNSKVAPTPIAIGLMLSKEDCSKSVNPTLYKSMVGSLMYLTATRPDMMHVVSLIFQIYGNTKGFPLASRKEDPKVCEWYQGIWNFVYCSK